MKVKKQKKRLLIFFSLFTVFLVCILFPKKLKYYELDLSNLQSAGDLFISDDMVCSALGFDVSSLFGDKKIVEFPSIVHNVSIYDKDIYFTYGVPGRVYRISSLGIPRMLTIDRVFDLCVQNGRMFWRDMDNTLFFSQGTIGSKKKIAHYVEDYTIVGDYVFYIAYDTRSLHSYNITQNKHFCICSENVKGDLIADKEYIYYSCFEYSEEEGYTNGRLYRTNYDGNDRILLSYFTCQNPHIYGDYIYYLNKQLNGLYRMKKDGTDDILIAKGNIGKFSIFDDKILFKRITSSPSSPAGYYLVNLTGQNEIMLEKD